MTLENLMLLLGIANLYGLAAFAINIASNFPYAYSVWHDPDVRPAASTWTIWMILDLVRAYYMYITDTFPYQMLSSAIGIAGILLVAIIGKKLIAWSKEDNWIAVAGTVIMAGGFLIGQTPFWILMASMVVLTAGSWPTFRKLYHQPYSEPAFPWWMSWFASLLQTLSASQTTFVAIGVSLWIMVFVSAILVLMYARRAQIIRA